MDESIQLIRPLAQRKDIDVDCRTISSSIVVDKTRIVQVLVNLLSNAVKFSPQRSKITVTCDDMGPSVTVSVQDEGTGLDANAISHAFDKFFQTETGTREGGFGLGLYISRLIVQQHGGTITVSSVENSGCVFSFTLPKLP